MDFSQNNAGGEHHLQLSWVALMQVQDRIAFVRKLLPGPEGARTAYMNVVARLSSMVAQTSQDAVSISRKSASLRTVPAHVFMQEIPTTPPSPRESPGGISRARADFLNASGPYTSAKARETERKSIINEILETEREYIRDLEIMQVISFPLVLTACAISAFPRMRPSTLTRSIPGLIPAQQFADELSTKSINDRDTLQRMLPNLLALLNFQQRFLISMEHVAEQPWPQQEWGRLFSDNVRAHPIVPDRPPLRPR